MIKAQKLSVSYLVSISDNGKYQNTNPKLQVNRKKQIRMTKTIRIFYI